MRYAITGASGQLGQLAADLLVKRVGAENVVLLTRDPGSLARFTTQGVTVRAADFDQPGTVESALAGVDRLLLVSIASVGESRRKAQRSAIDAAVRAGVRLVAYTSVPRPAADNPATAALDHHDTEEYLRSSGLQWIMLRNNLYADMQVDAIGQAVDRGTLVTNAGSGRAAYVTRADCAASAVAALTGTETNVAYDITGPDALDADDLTALATARAGRTIEVVNLDDASYTTALSQAGLPDDVVQVLTTFGISIREGWLSSPSSAVRDLTGVEPTSLRSLPV